MNAIDIIKEAVNNWPVSFPLFLKDEAERDLAYAMTRKDGPVKNAILARVGGINAALEAINDGEYDVFKENLNAGIVALHVACDTLCLTSEQRMQAASETWKQLEK